MNLIENLKEQSIYVNTKHTIMTMSLILAMEATIIWMQKKKLKIVFYLCLLLEDTLKLL
jgi:hypothetical protein